MLVYDDAAARDAALPSPSDGMVVGQEDSTRLNAYINGKWREYMERMRSDADGMVALLKELTAETRTTYNPNVYSYASAAHAVGAKDYEYVTAYGFFEHDGSYDWSAVHEDTIADGITQNRGNSGEFAMLNVEAWDPEDDPDELAENLRKVAEMWKSASEFPIGFYRIYPQSNSWDPVKLKRAIDGNTNYSEEDETEDLKEQMLIDDRNFDRVKDVVDLLLPRVHVSYNSDTGIAEWKWYATWSIMEALRISGGRPVYPVVSFRAWGEDPDEELTEARWIEMLQWVAAMPGIAGIAIYSGGDEPVAYTWTDAIEELTHSTGDFSAAAGSFGAVLATPDEITATNAGVAASINTERTEVTTNGDEDEDNVTLANGVAGQVKRIYCVAAGHANDTWKITPANMVGGTSIAFSGAGEGCELTYADDEGWVVTGNNGGTIS